MQGSSGKGKSQKDLQLDYWSKETNSRPFDHPIVRYFSNQRIEYLKGKIDFSTIRSAVEVGAGDGFATYPMSEVVPAIFATDPSRLMLAKNPLANGMLIQAAGEVLPFSDDSVDLAYCWEVLHHVEDVQSVVAEMRRVSRQYVIFFEPNRNNPVQFLFSLLKKVERGGLKFSKDYLRRVCEAAGLEVRSIETVGCLFPNTTPRWLFPLLKRFSFAQPLLGISNVVIARK